MSESKASQEEITGGVRLSARLGADFNFVTHALNLGWDKKTMNGEGYDAIDRIRHSLIDHRNVLIDLMNQIRKTNPVDDHGHELVMNRAYLEALKLLDA